MAAGVAVIWVLLASSGSVLAGRLAFIYVANLVTGLVSGFDLSWTVLGSLGMTALPLLVRAAYCALRRVPLDEPPPVSLVRPRDLVELVLIAVTTSTVASGITELLRSGTIGISLEAFVMLTARNAVAIVVIGAVLLVVRDRFRERGTPAALNRPSAMRGRAVELVLLVLASAGIGVLIFTRGSDSPLGFTAMLVIAWVGYRFDPLVVSIYNLVFTIGVVVMTVAGYGPFAALDDPWEGAALVQFFAAVTSVVALMLSLGVAERRQLEAVLAEHEAEARVRKERTRLAREVNDTILQALVAAETALDLQLPGQARHNIGEASQQARHWIGELYDEEEVRPGAAVRREPAKTPAGRSDG